MRIAIIGAGAAGLMAAATIAETDPEIEVLLFERNREIGRKVALSGGGRCNLTTGLSDLHDILSRYPRGAKFLSSAMRRFPPEDVRGWFGSHDVPTEVEPDLRVFPRSGVGSDVIAAFRRLFGRPGSRVRVLTDVRVTAIGAEKDEFEVRTAEGETYKADRLILTTGGQAYRATGSTGDGYSFAESLGHRLTPLAPSLHSLTLAEPWAKELSGVSLQRVVLSAVGRKESWTGPIMFTHRGITGPAVFALSALLAHERFDEERPIAISIDIFPEESAEALTKRVLETCRKDGKKSLRSVLGFLVPKALVPAILSVSGVDGDMQAAQASKAEAEACAEAMKGLAVSAVGRGAGDEFVTAGGVRTDEVDQRTMESKIRPGLFFAGEILDVDGVTGGFNLQAAWATGRAAGLAASR